MSNLTINPHITEDRLHQIKSSHLKTGNGFVKALSWPRLFGKGEPYENINWDIRTAKITKSDGSTVFEQKEVEVPSFWSQTATDIVASKYFRGRLGTNEREISARQLINRVSNTIASWGWKENRFVSEEDCENFRQDLKFLLINQYAAFNSPVWFNVGVFDYPQCSACFILAVEDNMKSIIEWVQDEAWIFKGGSGSGVNLSKLRSSKEPLSKGGHSSGPVSFMKAADGMANSIRSGGTTRRAAKMVVLNVDHPDIKDFVYSKKIIEDMTKALARAGIKDSIAAELFDPYTLLPYQNANNSVRVTDDFMHAVKENRDWPLRAIITGEVLEKFPAREILRWCADAAWQSADPGMQYDTTINDWHTCPHSGRINASNPCSEYMHLDNSACNLASLNLLKFLREDGTFDVESFKKAVQVMITAQDIIVDNSSYPTEKITRNSRDYRQLGLGYANLGALIMSMGFPYDSERGRAVGGCITSLMCGQAYLMSSVLAQSSGPFAGYLQNKDQMIRVIEKHKGAADNLASNISSSDVIKDQGLVQATNSVWQEALDRGRQFGYRNSQVTVLAPTGTIAFMMDCDTTGVEPELALVRYKKLVGGGIIKLVNGQVPKALRTLGYQEEQIKLISDFLLENDTIEGAPGLKDEHLEVFDCSFKAQNGKRSIHYMGHLKMMSAAQPFISGAISKTVNLPNDATVEDIEKAFVDAWELGIKAVAFYRDGSKTIQPLSTSKEDKLVEQINGYKRVKLPDERPSLTHKFSIGGYEGYITTGLYPETQKPGETFLVAAKEGSTISGLLDTIATLISMCLQSGIPLKTLIRKFKDMRFEPSGFTNNPDIPVAKSIIDYIFRYLGYRFLDGEDREELFGPVHEQENAAVDSSKTIAKLALVSPGNEIVADAPVCQCGTIMFKAGSCFTCPNCFAVTGVCN